MKKTLLFIMALLLSVGAKAETEETKLWEDTYSSTIVIDPSTSSFATGQILRIYTTSSESAGNVRVYIDTAESYGGTAFQALEDQYPYMGAGTTYFDIQFTAGDITAMAGKKVLVANGSRTPSRVTLIKPKAKDVEMWTGEKAITYAEGGALTALSWGDKGEFSNACINDVIKITLSTTGEEKSEIKIGNPNKSWNEFEGGSADYDLSKSTTEYTYAISSAVILEDIQTVGIVIQGNNITITKVELIEPANRYNAMNFVMGETGYATFSSDTYYDFTESGLTPYYASDVTTGTVTLTSVNATSAWQGYIVKGAKGNHTVRVTVSAKYPSPNYLKQNVNSSTIAASTVGTYNYIFAKNSSDEVGFHKLTSAHILGANKAYLETATDITPTSGSRIALVFDDGETTYIDALPMNNEKRMENTEYYNLAGQRVAQPTKGLYIVNGKKVIIK